jgi:tetratricopeptide (TPR) repeat protein
MPQTDQKSLLIAYLDSLLVAYLLTWLAILMGLAVVGVQVLRTGRSVRSAGRRSSWRGKLLLLAVSLSLSLLVLEAGAAVWHNWLHRRPRLPSASAMSETVMPALPSNLPVTEGSSGKTIRILVIGESSGRGEPYNPWLSVGQMLAWYLEPVFPGRKIDVDIWAVGGAMLEEQHQKLAALTYRPDVLIVYVGHNEFQGRYTWKHEVDYYADDFTGWALPRSLSASLAWSPLCGLIVASRERQRINVAPTRVVTRERVDRPVCTEAESARILADFRTRLEEITSFCESIGTLPILIIPASGDALFEPSRSILKPSARKAERAAFAHEAAKALTLERTDIAAAIERYRALIAAHPEFADLHYRLAELLNRRGQWPEAKTHYILARENDALPLRCREPFREVYREIAARHRSAVLIDGPAVLEALSRHGILDATMFHDPQHPNLRGYSALTQNLLTQLHDRKLLGWPATTPVPEVDPAACERHFGIDNGRWALVCRREAAFYRTTAYARFDPKARNLRSRAYDRAADRLQLGGLPAEAGIPGWDPIPAGSRLHFIPVPAIGTESWAAWPGR